MKRRQKIVYLCSDNWYEILCYCQYSEALQVRMVTKAMNKIFLIRYIPFCITHDSIPCCKVGVFPLEKFYEVSCGIENNWKYVRFVKKVVSHMGGYSHLCPV